MISHIKDVLGVMIIVASVIALGMLASFTGPLVAGLATTGLFGFSGVGAAMLVPMSIQYPEQDL